MGIKSTGKSGNRVGDCDVENGYKLWKAAAEDQEPSEARA
jgi:hypothetical protein